MFALIGAFVAGVLTTLAPCVLPLLPITVGGTVGARWRPYLITASLGASVVIFTLALRATTALIEIPPQTWRGISAGILILLGLVSLFPTVWDWISIRLGLQARAATGLQAAATREGAWGAVLIGAALGPVFSSCSPLYGYVIVTVLPAQFGYGLALLIAYAVGLCLTLLVIALLGRRLVVRLGWAADSHGWFRRSLGLLFVVVGVAIWFGLDQTFQTWVIENSPIRPWELDRGFIPEA
jgi:cytochrome c-type biogenesis protein